MPYSCWKGYASLTALFFFYLAFSQIRPCSGHAGANHLRLIDENGTFVNPAEIDEALALWNLSTVAGNYFIVAIEGPQSSGKSTTLNNLFQTKFQVMDPSVLTQTTTGIWMAPVRGTNIIVLDAEGSDSRERHKEGNVINERKTLSFTLAHANVLMITILKRQISTYNGAGLPLLQTILERNLKLFPHSIGEDAPPIKKVLLFLILDDGQTPFNRLKHIIRTNIEHIWEDITHDGRSLHDYFVLDFYSFPDHIHNRDEFDAAMLSLRSRFHDGSGGLLSHSSGTNIPITALTLYMQRNHMAIQTDKEFNLPTQRQMALEHRMIEIVKKTSEWVRDEIVELRSKGNPGAGFGTSLSDILERSLDRLSSDTAAFSRVLPGYEGYLEDFRRSVLENLKHVYVESVHQLQSSYQEAYSAELTTLTSLREFLDKAEKFKSEKLQAFVITQEEALEPDWVNHQIRENLNRQLNGMRDAAQLSSRLQPLTHSKYSKVGHTKYMRTNARLYGDGRLELDVYTEIGSFNRELHGRVEVFLKDKDGAVVASTPTLRCTTRESFLFGTFGDSDGTDLFSHRFSPDVVRRTALLDIIQWKA